MGNTCFILENLKEVTDYSYTFEIRNQSICLRKRYRFKCQIWYFKPIFAMRQPTKDPHEIKIDYNSRYEVIEKWKTLFDSN